MLAIALVIKDEVHLYGAEIIDDDIVVIGIPTTISAEVARVHCQAGYERTRRRLERQVERFRKWKVQKQLKAKKQ